MNCQIIRDLLPLYCDDVCSRESRQAVEEHLAVCPDCQRVFQGMRREKAVVPFPTDGKEEARVLETVKRRFSRQRVKAVIAAAAVTVLLIATLTAASGLERPVPYREGLVTARLAEDTAIDIDFDGNYAAIYGFSREIDGREAVFFCCTKNLRAALPIRSERHIVIGNGLFTDFETGYFKVPREVDAVYYLAGDYRLLPTLGDEEFQAAAEDAVAVWEREG